MDYIFHWNFILTGSPCSFEAECVIISLGHAVAKHLSYANLQNHNTIILQLNSSDILFWKHKKTSLRIAMQSYCSDNLLPPQSSCKFVIKMMQRWSKLVFLGYLIHANLFFLLIHKFKVSPFFHYEKYTARYWKKRVKLIWSLQY